MVGKRTLCQFCNKQFEIAMRNKILLFLLTFIGISQIAAASAVRDKYNFNSEWLLYVGDIPEAKEVRFQDTDWKKVT